MLVMVLKLDFNDVIDTLQSALLESTFWGLLVSLFFICVRDNMKNLRHSISLAKPLYTYGRVRAHNIIRIAYNLDLCEQEKD